MENRLSKGVVTVALLLALGWLLAETPLAQGQQKTVTVTGLVGDSICGNAHISGTAKQCTVRCVKNMKAEYALIVGQRVYTLQGKIAELEKFAGARAKVTGYLRGESIMVTAVVSGETAQAPDMD